MPPEESSCSAKKKKWKKSESSCCREYWNYFVTFHKIELEKKGGTWKVAWHELKIEGLPRDVVEIGSVECFFWAASNLGEWSAVVRVRVGIGFHFGPSPFLQTHEFHGRLKPKKTGRKQQTTFGNRAPSFKPQLRPNRWQMDFWLLSLKFGFSLVDFIFC